MWYTLLCWDLKIIMLNSLTLERLSMSKVAQSKFLEALLLKFSQYDHDRHFRNIGKVNLGHNDKKPTNSSAITLRLKIAH